MKEKIGIIIFTIGVVLGLTSWLMAMISGLQGPEGTYPIEYFDWNKITLLLPFVFMIVISVGGKMAKRAIYEFPLWVKYVLVILPSIVCGSVGVLFSHIGYWPLLVVFVIFAFILTYLAVQVFRKKWTNKQKIMSLLLSFGLLSILIVFFWWAGTSGFCNFNQCDTSVEISEIKVPESIHWETNIPAGFVIANTGNEEAKNCKLSWRYPTDEENSDIMFSSIFSLSPEKEKKIHFLSEQGVKNTGWGFGLPYCYVPYLYDLKWTAKVSCETASPTEVEKPILIECMNK
jgi:hypothetical protein